MKSLLTVAEARGHVAHIIHSRACFVAISFPALLRRDPKTPFLPSKRAVEMPLEAITRPTLFFLAHRPRFFYTFAAIAVKCRRPIANAPYQPQCQPKSFSSGNFSGSLS
jgi:hypothetical protein